MPKIGGVVEESVGVNREAIKLVTKGLHRSKHCIGTSHGISEHSYGGEDVVLGGPGKGNMLSGCLCRDVSRLIFKELENKRLGIVMKSKHNKNVVQRVVIAFVDDSDFCTKGNECEKKMQEIVEYYTSMCEATGGKVQQEKVMMFNWTWKKNTIVEVVINVTINGEKVQCINVLKP